MGTYGGEENSPGRGVGDSFGNVVVGIAVGCCCNILTRFST